MMHPSASAGSILQVMCVSGRYTSDILYIQCTGMPVLTQDTREAVGPEVVEDVIEAVC